MNVKQEGHVAFGMILALGARSPPFNWNGPSKLSSKFFGQPQTYCDIKSKYAYEMLDTKDLKPIGRSQPEFN